MAGVRSSDPWGNRPAAGPWTGGTSSSRRGGGRGRVRRHRASKIGGLLLMAASISLMALLLWRAVTAAIG